MTTYTSTVLREVLPSYPPITYTALPNTAIARALLLVVIGFFSNHLSCCMKGNNTVQCMNKNIKQAIEKAHGDLVMLKIIMHT